MEMLKQKLASRKLWAAILAAAAAVVAALFGDQLTPEIVDAVEAVVKVAIAYIFGEGAVDIGRIVADAIKKAYEIPDVSEIVAAIGAEENGNG